MAAVRFKVDKASHTHARTLMPSISFRSDAACQGSFEGMTAICGVTATVRKKRFHGPETSGRQFVLYPIFGCRHSLLLITLIS